MHVCYSQCWRKLLLKEMRYNIALLPKKSNYLRYFLWKVMHYITFALLFKYEQGLIVFNTISCNYSKRKSPFNTKKCNE